MDVEEVAVVLYTTDMKHRKAAEVMSLLLTITPPHETRGAMADGVLQAVEAFRRRPLP
jgi:transposase-like protein